MNRTPNPRGFTLIEALIALSLLALLALLGYRAMTSLLDAQAQLASASEHWGRLDQMFARIESDLRAALPRATRLGSASSAPFELGPDGEGGTMLALSRAGPEFTMEAASPGQRIAYHWRPAAGRVELHYWPALDNATATPAETLLVADGIRDLRYRLLGSSGEWFEHWPAPSQMALPEAIAVAVQLESGEWVDRLITLR